MQQHNYNVTGYMCDCKYRNLLSTYRKNKEKMGVTGDSHCPWVHFDLMDKHLGHGSTVEETEESNYASHSALNNDLVQEVEEVVKNSKGLLKTH